MALITAAAVVATMLIMLCLVNRFKLITVFACLFTAALMLIKKRRTALAGHTAPEVIALTAYILVAGVSLIWAEAGKFFLREYSKLLISFAIYISLIACLADREKGPRSAALAAALAAAIFSFLSVDTASSRLTEALVRLVPEYEYVGYGFESGTRLTGIFGNGNILAGVLAIGIFLSLYLAGSAENRRGRLFATVLLSINAYGFLLAFSMGATAMFALGVAAYLIFAGKERGEVLIRMFGAAVPTLVFVFAAFAFFAASGAGRFVPVIAMALNAAVSCLIEYFLHERLSRSIRATRMTAVPIAAAVALISAYLIAALTVTGEAELAAGESLRRAVYPGAGDNSLIVEASAEAEVSIYSQNMPQIMMHTETRLYRGTASGASFTVPEDSKVVYINISAKEPLTVYSAKLSSGEKLKLNYRLLPGFMANRIQGLLANQNAVQRTVFFNDGIKLFMKRPLLGNGPGSFESMICGVQDFFYSTKYVHNNYIQVLLDNGILGFLPYIVFLLLTARTLWKGRRRKGEERKDALHPALCAAFVFTCGHSAAEVTMSSIAYLPFAFVVFALAAGVYGKAVGFSEKAAVQAVRWITLAVASVYAVLIFLNIAAYRGIKDAEHKGGAAFYAAVRSALRIECFERNQYYLTYVANAVSYGSPTVLYQADEYAEKLLDTRSNSLHKALITYYLERGNVEKAVEAAKNGAGFNYANPDIWNGYFELMGSFAQSGGLDAAGSSALKKGICELYSLMREYNERLMSPITLSEAAEQAAAAAGCLQ